MFLESSFRVLRIIEDRRKCAARFGELNNEQDEARKIQQKRGKNTLRLWRMGARPSIWKCSKYRLSESLEDVTKIMRSPFWHSKC